MSKILEKSIASAEEGKSSFSPPSISSHKNTMVRKTTLPSLKENMVTIYRECDPVKFLCDVANGKPVECHYVDEEGNLVTFYEAPSLGQRIRVNQYLANKLMPKMSINVEAEANHDGRSFSQLVEHAASNAEAKNE